MGISVKQARNISSVLSEGLPYIQKFKGKTIVVKYGGAAMSDLSLKRNFTRDIALMNLVGMKPVIVHGGGPQIAKELNKSGITSKFISGHRVTDKPTMAVVKEILGKQINREIVNLIRNSGADSIGFNHIKPKIIKSSKYLSPEKIDLGLVGKVDRILISELKRALSLELVPVIAPIGVNKDGSFLNINADVVAGKVAESLKAEKLILLTDIKGILGNNNKLISKISTQKGMQLIKNNIIQGGMTPKLIAALEAKKKGVKSCHIIDGRLPHAVLLEVLTAEGVGTMIS